MALKHDPNKIVETFDGLIRSNHFYNVTYNHEFTAMGHGTPSAFEFAKSIGATMTHEKHLCWHWGASVVNGMKITIVLTYPFPENENN
jgi:hypothetical protein